VHKTLGGIFLEARRRSGLTIREISKASGLTSSQISQLETGKRPEPGFKTVAKLAKALRISMDDIAAEMGLLDLGDDRKTLEPSARAHLALLRELQLAKADAAKLLARLENAAAESQKPRKKLVKRG